MAVAGRRMSFGKRYSPPGSAPGTLRAPDAPGAGPVRVTVMDYGPERLIEKEVHSVAELAPYRDTPTVTWINVEGLSDVPFLEGLGQLFGFHPLTLEDVLNCGQRPKLEDYGDYHFLVMKSLALQDDCLQTEQISFFLSGNYVITLQEVPGDSFEAVRERIRQTKGQIRKMGPDYLLYALVDALMDEFFPVLERYGERIEELEDEVVLRPVPATLNQVHGIKRDLLMLRRTAWPEREVIGSLQREEAHLVRPETRVFLRDCYDHAVQVIDMIETYRDLASGMLDVYLSSTSNRLNEVMKVLTIISTIFIPLSFIASVYGMNFNPQASPLNMPELNWYFGYPAVLAVMAVTGGGLVLYFKRKGWF
jgi:magnesium transporter